MSDIRFSIEPAYGALGRNGISHAFGIRTARVLDEVHIHPINSRGGTTRCRIPVPVADLPALIAALQTYLSDPMRSTPA